MWLFMEVARTIKLPRVCCVSSHALCIIWVFPAFAHNMRVNIKGSLLSVAQPNIRESEKWLLLCAERSLTAVQYSFMKQISARKPSPHPILKHYVWYLTWYISDHAGKLSWIRVELTLKHVLFSFSHISYRKCVFLASSAALGTVMSVGLLWSRPKYSI